MTINASKADGHSALHSVMFHHFYDEKHVKGQGAISADQLTAMIEKIGPQRIVGADECMDAAIRGESLKNAIALTFDDGLLCQYDIARPVLDAFKIRAFWFVNTSVLHGEVTQSLEMYRFFRTTAFETMELFYAAFQRTAKAEFGELIGKALYGFKPETYLRHATFYTNEDRTFRYLRDIVLGPERYHQCMAAMFEAAGFQAEEAAALLWIGNVQLRRLSDDGHVIGLHSHSHPTCISAMSYDEQTSEYQRNFDHIQAVTSVAPRAMSHPCNSYNQDSLEVLRAMGIAVGFRADGEMADHPHSSLELPRTDHAVLIDRLGL